MYGTISTLDQLKSTWQTVEDFGQERLADSLMSYFNAHNQRMREFMSDFVDRTTEKEMIYGTTDTMTMTRTDEFGRPDAQKIAYGTVCGFPLHSYQGTLQWTRKNLQSMPVAEFTNQFLALRTADIQRVTTEAMRALFVPTDYDFTDYLMPRRTQVPLKVRRLVNGDGEGIPTGPNGEVFDSDTHTHYLATAALTGADITALTQTVMEHYLTGDPVIFINMATQNALRAFVEYVPLQPANIVAQTADFVATGPALRQIPFTNRMVGYWNGIEVWVKPWVPAGYIVCALRGQNKPLVMRTRTPNSGNLVLAVRDERYPLEAETFEREFGIGVWERTNAAVLYTGGATYAAPTFAD